MATSLLSARSAAISMSSDTSLLSAALLAGSPAASPGSAGSFPGKAGLPRSVLDEAAHARLGVLGSEQPGEVQPLDLQPGVQIDLKPLVAGLLGAPPRPAGPGPNPRGELERRRVALGVRNHLVDQADGQCLGRTD